ncbi:MAG: IS91 family transposase [Gammaproteobacteria bacterium]|nr:IS91 family transposase [Gammaproteobacteria bacterium]
MIRLAAVIKQFESEYLSTYKHQLLPSHKKALTALKFCRTEHSPKMLMRCSDCEHQTYVPHSCGHRNCPHCQHHESQQWLERQVQKQVPAPYFMITFTLPKELRSVTWQHQREVYTLMFKSAWETLQTFSLNDKKLQGTPGVVAVLHTHSRRLDYHPHIHAVLPAAVINKENRLWRKKGGKYLFNHKALAKVFRAKMLAGLVNAGLQLPQKTPEKWVVDCQSVGAGDKALVYLGRYLYRGVIREKDILTIKDGQVTFRYQDSKTKKSQTRTVSGAHFVWLILQHVLPARFRRARDYGFIHPNSKALIQAIHLLFKFDPKKWLPKLKPRPQMRCECCGAQMRIIQVQIKETPPDIKIAILNREGPLAITHLLAM